MGLRSFDRKFGVDLLRDLPEAPAVYCFKDESGAILYVGKAKNARRRLAQYRNATRRKVHRKQRELVRVAHALEVELVASEQEALLRENDLIRAHRPAYNVDGAYAFLYPAIGTGLDERGRLLLCIATQPDAHDALALRWHGCFRPRWRAREAFDALASLFARVGHLEPRGQLPAGARGVKGTRLVALRRIGPEWLAPLHAFLDGESDALLGRLFDVLLERPDARGDRETVQQAFDALRDFSREDARRLCAARRRVAWVGTFVPQAERDALFIRAREQREEREAPAQRASRAARVAREEMR